MILGLRAAARELGISHVGLWKAQQAGRVQKLPDGKYDVEACRAALEQNSHPGQARAGRSQKAHQDRLAAMAVVPSIDEVSGGAYEVATTTPEADRSLAASGIVASPVPRFEPTPDPNSIAEAGRQLEWEKVREKRLKLDREEGRLVPIAEVNAFVAGMIISARDELIRIAREEAGSLSQTSDPIACER